MRADVHPGLPQRLTITQGVGDTGSGVVNNGTTGLDHVRIAFNVATFGGGGVWNLGRLTVTDNEILGNTADRMGGGGLLTWGGTATISRSLLTQNTADNASGGGLADLGGVVTVEDSTITRNHAPAGNGGGIDLIPFDDLSLTLRHVTVSGNDARLGGELEPVATRNLTIDGSVFAGNLGGDCGPGIGDDITEGLFHSRYSMDSDGTTSASRWFRSNVHCGGPRYPARSAGCRSRTAERATGTARGWW